MALAQPAPPPRRYRAFISYRHTPEDARWAKWLENSLETYKVPKPLIKQGFPEKIGRLFRDEDELPVSSDLSEQIKQALTTADFLIVICSPSTPQSKWVTREIELFASLGKADSILPVLIRGDKQTSYPAPLHNLVTSTGIHIEPIAADLRPGRERIPPTQTPFAEIKRFAILKIVACLIRCHFDDLRQRESERLKAEKRKRNWLTTAAVLVLLTLTGFAYKKWHDYTSTLEFSPWEFSTGVGSRGTPYCVIIAAVDNKNRGQNIAIKGFKSKKLFVIDLFKDSWNRPQASTVNVMFDFTDNQPITFPAYADAHILDIQIPTESVANFLLQVAENPTEVIIPDDQETWFVRADGAKEAIQKLTACMK